MDSLIQAGCRDFQVFINCNVGEGLVGKKNDDRKIEGRDDSMNETDSAKKDEDLVDGKKMDHLRLLLSILKASAKEVPINKLAIGVAGLGACGALIVFFNSGIAKGIVAITAVLLFMAILLVLGWAKSRRPAGEKALISVFLWFLVLSFMSLVVLCLLAVAISWPPRLSEVIYGSNLKESGGDGAPPATKP